MLLTLGIDFESADAEGARPDSTLSEESAESTGGKLTHVELGRNFQKTYVTGAGGEVFRNIRNLNRREVFKKHAQLEPRGSFTKHAQPN